MAEAKPSFSHRQSHASALDGDWEGREGKLIDIPRQKHRLKRDIPPELALICAPAVIFAEMWFKSSKCYSSSVESGPACETLVLADVLIAGWLAVILVLLKCDNAMWVVTIGRPKFSRDS